MTESESKAAMIWIIGEYAEKITNSLSLLEFFIESFVEESLLVQLQLLTASVKLYLKRPNEGQDVVQKLLQTATKCENADLRDRAYIYWRMLSSDPQKTREVVLCEKPPIVDDLETVDKNLLEVLIRNISTLASVFHKPPHLFVSNAVAPSVYVAPIPRQKAPAAGSSDVKEIVVDNLLDLNFDDSTPQSNTPNAAVARSPVPAILDLLSDDISENISPVSYGFSSPNKIAKEMETFLSAAEGKGLEIKGCFSRVSGNLSLDLLFINTNSFPVQDFAIQFNKNRSKYFDV